jgi:4-hydroxy-3-methylbut-2-enyl diphosphate reductase
VEKVWNRAEKLGKESYTVVIHGKPKHEETRATFSHSAQGAPSVIVRDMEDARKLGEYILLGDYSDFATSFGGKHSNGFDPTQHLDRIGVVNQTTMLATETQAIADYLRSVMVQKFGENNVRQHFADTRDTLCYATNDNQDATYELLKTKADFAIVVGGYNSSNTSHIVELCERAFPTFINSEKEIRSKDEIHHFDYPNKVKKITRDFIPAKGKVNIVLTSGASCPDTLVDRVMLRILDFYSGSKPVSEVLEPFSLS